MLDLVKQYQRYIEFAKKWIYINGANRSCAFIEMIQEHSKQIKEASLKAKDPVNVPQQYTFVIYVYSIQ